VQAQIPTKTGPRSRILQNEEGYKTGSRNATTVSLLRQASTVPSNNQTGKKLKKRLEDLERRAGSNSASPEQRHEELARSESVTSDQTTHSTDFPQRSTSNQAARARTPEVLNQHYVLPSTDHSMFSQTYTRQLSTSPPPFSYTGLPSTGASYGYSQATTYCSLPTTSVDMPLYHQYLPATEQAYRRPTPSIKHEPAFYFDDDQSPFAASYAAISGVDVSTADSSYPYVSTRPHQPPPFNRSYSAPEWPSSSG